ncbi:MAG: N-acetyl-gamma-glutamyl-phosphate reductase [Candidatus Bathyarchaeota archaeon]|nr:MAG: N-acetyl-gamma-glutamyl-phosphate reductase [Candidatus Bathyarchaeota archaeon]
MRVGIIGGSGYTGGELLRILALHPSVNITAVVSRRYAGEYVFRAQPNLRKQTRMKFLPLDTEYLRENCDIVFTATPHGSTVDIVSKLLEAEVTVIDMSADFRLKNPADYNRWYGWTHQRIELLDEAVYGLPELHREEIKNARLIACPGCNATVIILGLAPLIKEGMIEENRIIVDGKVGSSGAGITPSLATHHPERFGGVRAYSVLGHRHIAEVEQELNFVSKTPVTVAFTPHAVNMVRGILATIHTFPKEKLDIRDIWRVYRSFFKNEPFIRLIREAKGLYRLPNPNIVIGSNFCDIGFELDNHINRLIVFSAIDNLVKGAAGQGVQCLNIILGIDEKTGLEAQGFHPM